MAEGYLIIQARTAEDAIPLADVQVKIMDTGNNVLYELRTDENGNTEKISLQTVDRSLSLDSSYEGTPYTSYNMEASSSHFDSLYISGIHIFDGETACQPVTLIPLPENRSVPVMNQLFIGEVAVEMNTPRNQEGPAVEPFILRHVVIPNPITVHLGIPSSSAINVQVYFPDYVKNVACSEIYPTWPRAALVSNIYAIITFALNRVFTEWYRSKGYNFDITSSPAYDQYFVYGRTIYESVSDIVDDIFNQYIRQQGQIAPYFSSFCNGTTVTCSGMSQWGTVSLANQGIPPLDILRSYYPEDIEIAETHLITDVIISYPGAALRLGSTGLDVQTIQTYLERIRKNYPAIPPIDDPPGVFGTSTQAAVTKFQTIFNLTPDGVVGKATWNKISSIYTSVARLAELDREGAALGIEADSPDYILSLGSTGINVLTLQYLMEFIGKYYPGIARVAQSGIFDAPTAHAVTTFQQMTGLNPNGVADRATWNKLYELYWGIMDNAPGPAQEPGIMNYIVQPRDTVWLLAQRFHTSVDDILKENNLKRTAIYTGQELRIPVNSMGPDFQYTVQRDDTLWLIAQKFNTTADEIKKLNNLSSNLILIGEKLLIPTEGLPS